MVSRRSLLQTMGAMGIMGQGAFMVPESRANTNNHYFAFIWARGAWDATSFSDPKGNHLYHERFNSCTSDPNHPNCPPTPINKFTTQDIQQIGNLNIAPYFGDIKANDYAEQRTDYEDFFANNYQDMMVINGINAQSNNHNPGTENMWAGLLSGRKYPTIGALIGASKMDEYALPFMAFGGYRYTANLLAAGQLANTKLLTNMIDPVGGVVDERVVSIIEQAQNSRNIARIQREISQQRQVMLQNLYDVRTNNASMVGMEQELPDTISSNDYFRQAEIAAAAFKSNFSVTCNLDVGGFDTHNDNDNRQFVALSDVFKTTDYLIQLLKEKGIYEQTTIVIGSEFGRRPWYNHKDGKDHWSTTSMIMLGKNVPKNTVVGATDDQLQYQHIHPETLAIQTDKSTGIEINPQNIHLFYSAKFQTYTIYAYLKDAELK